MSFFSMSMHNTLFRAFAMITYFTILVCFQLFPTVDGDGESGVH